MKHLAVFVVLLSASIASAQRGGKGGGGPPQQGGTLTPEDPKKGKLVDEIRTTLPQHPPIAKNPWPSKNAQMLGRLIFAEQPKVDLTRYLDAMWNDGKDVAARKAAFAALWDEAEKPKWARAAIEDYFRQHSKGVELKSDPPATPPPPKSPDATPPKPSTGG